VKPRECHAREHYNSQNPFSSLEPELQISSCIESRSRILAMHGIHVWYSCHAYGIEGNLVETSRTAVVYKPIRHRRETWRCDTMVIARKRRSTPQKDGRIRRPATKHQWLAFQKPLTYM
jgi:hypothetical protein